MKLTGCQGCAYMVSTEGETDMTNIQARDIFNQAAAAAKGGADAVARIELAREYFTNPKFRRGLEDYLWERRA